MGGASIFLLASKSHRKIAEAGVGLQLCEAAVGAQLLGQLGRGHGQGWGGSSGGGSAASADAGAGAWPSCGSGGGMVGAVGAA